MDLGEQLVGLLESVRDEMRPEDLELAERNVKKFAELSARRIAGQDVEHALIPVRIVLDNIRVGLQSSLGDKVRETVSVFIGDVLRTLLR